MYGFAAILATPGSKNIPKLYYEKNYTEIESYIKKEAGEFSIFCSKLYEELPALLNKLRSSSL